MTATPIPATLLDDPAFQRLVACLQATGKLHPVTAERCAERIVQAWPGVLVVVRGVMNEALLALQLLHDDMAEYGRINNIGGYGNHAMRAAREALRKSGIDRVECANCGGEHVATECRQKEKRAAEISPDSPSCNDIATVTDVIPSQARKEKMP